MLDEALAHLVEAMQYTFIQRALIAGSCVALCCALLGVFLVLRRFSLIGDGLGHVSFGAIGLCLFLNLHPVYYSIPVVMAASLYILRLSGKQGVQGDAAIGLTSAIGIACGMMLASLGGGFNVDLFSYLFGNILVISRTEVILSILLALLVLAIVVLLYHDLFVTAFEEDYAHVLGTRTGRINIILVICTALTVVLSIRIVGTLLVSSLIILPAVGALQIGSGFKTTMIIAVIVSILSVWAGMVISYIGDLPTGATIVLVNFGFFLMASLGTRLLKRS